MSGVRRIGIFGGSFDPPHLAHVALARAAVDQLGLDELRILPTGQAWHKSRELTAAAHRLEMAQLAFAGIPHAVVDDRELRRAGPTYTIDTLRELRAESPGAQLLLVIGADQAEALHGWRDSAGIVGLATLAVAARARPDAGAPPFDASQLPAGRWLPVELPSMPVSATLVRALAAAGQDVASLVPPGVASYIARHHLYRPT
ncbi:nicotinate (nicotinamide) nucleotide adenylyltransferase [Ramlibacter algicola]|uniref:Probable nicotinate-nucleotide adenylyltransferase n=1 Tax=Ramlibacter algicola TaxID=2795217 RepID=A0A934Q303_9BURK|nr:nicotinate (nicotinamide) nucleotide adenylyltransferase [Ramlibacter algicola]MBK0393312.1 nicotinate (nicotinamide) nucleotide adenylyltransferase [Ramlibacter algicola]